VKIIPNMGNTIPIQRSISPTIITLYETLSGSAWLLLPITEIVPRIVGAENQPPQIVVHRRRRKTTATLALIGKYNLRRLSGQHISEEEFDLFVDYSGSAPYTN
jgi:hypothetical protein